MDLSIDSSPDCQKCDQNISFAEQLNVKLDELEEDITVTYYDPFSANSKFRIVISEMRVLLSKLQGQTDSDGNTNGNVELLNERNAPQNSSSQNFNQVRQQFPGAKFQKVSSQRKKEIANADKLIKKSGSGEFKCTTCHTQFSSIRTARRHVMVLHLEIGNRCPSCFTVYFNEENLQAHIPKCGKSSQVKSKNNQKKKTNKIGPGKPTSFQSSTATSSAKQSTCAQVKIRNPPSNFDLDRALTVKVLVPKLDIEHENKLLPLIQVGGEIEESRIQVKDPNSKTIDLGQIRREMSFGKERFPY